MGDVIDREGRKSMGRAGPSPMQGGASSAGASTPVAGARIDKRLAQVQV